MLKATLVVIGGDAKAAEISLSLPTTIGRGREVTLTLPHPLVSRQHCELFERDGVLQVRDLNSLNGTYVDSHRIEGTAELRPDQLLTIGNVTFRAIYRIGGQVDVTPADGSGAANQPVEQESQVIEFEEMASRDADSRVDLGAEALRERKTTPGPQAEPQADPLPQAAAHSSDVLDEAAHDTPVANQAPEHSIVAAMQRAGFSRPSQETPDSASEIQRMLPNVPRTPPASDLSGLANPHPEATTDNDNFQGIETGNAEQPPMPADEPALDSFIRKLPR